MTRFVVPFFGARRQVWVVPAAYADPGGPRGGPGPGERHHGGDRRLHRRDEPLHQALSDPREYPPRAAPLSFCCDCGDDERACGGVDDKDDDHHEIMAMMMI